MRQLFEKISKLLIHEGDLFGIVSSGPSSISVDMTYDKKRLDEAIKKIHGDGLKPSEIIQRAGGSEGPTELRHRAHVAFSTMMEGLANLEKVTNRRKALVWVSEGYDFNPFQQSRFGLLRPDSPFLQNQSNQALNQANQADPTNPDAQQNPNADPITSAQMQNETFSDADLAYELSEITRAANRANTTIYTLDPRGLVAGQDIDEPVDPQEWSEHLRKTQDTMRVLADDTGGISVVNQNDFDKALKRIDADSSDYYILGYYSSNPDPDAPPAEDRGQGASRRAGCVHEDRIPCAQTSAAARVELEEVARRFAFRMRALPRSGSARTFFTSEVRCTASFRYVSSMSDPMKLTPSLAHATAVLPRPVNGSIAVSILERPCSFKHCSGRRAGKVAGCGRSRSRRWIVSYGMNQVFPRQRTPSAAARHRLMFDWSW